MATISGDDQYCRYLCAPGGETNQHRFGRFLDRLGIELPFSLREIVQYGWIKPVLRVRLPESFYLNWEHYPILTFPEPIAEADKWAANLYIRCATSRAATLDKLGPLEGNWYTHFFDREDHPLSQEARAHVIPAGPETEDPSPIKHPRRNQTIYPWIDFFSYWQVYELVEILRAAILFSPIRATPDAAERIQTTLNEYDHFRELAQMRIERIQNAWAERRAVFGWLSRYRTLLGAWVGTHSDWSKVREAAPELLNQLGLTPEDLKRGIRDTLLTLWQDWEPWKGKHEAVPRLVRLHLQEDIDRAVDFLRQATGEKVDLEDPFWGVPEGGEDRGWTPLPDVLPYEAFTAKADFPIQASIYLEGCEHLFPKPFNEARLHKLTVDWWPKSVAFRRFCLAFRRLHQFFDSKDENRLGLKESTPIEFLILCTLHGEKILRDRFLEKSPSANSPDFTPLIKQSAEAAIRSTGIKSADVAAAISELRAILQAKAGLHDLHLNPRNPFVTESDFTSDNPLTRYLLACFSNFAILRNYMAHHDSIDDQIIETPMAEVVFEALLIVPIMILDI